MYIAKDMGNEHVIPEFIKKFKNLKIKILKIIGTEMKLDHLFISMIL